MTPNGSALASQHGQRCGHLNGTGLCDSLIHKYESFLGEKWMWLNSFGSVRQEAANRKHVMNDYMDRVIKTHRTLHIFLPHNTDKSSALWGGVGWGWRGGGVTSGAGLSHYCFPKNTLICNSSSVVLCSNSVELCELCEPHLLVFSSCSAFELSGLL